MNLAREWTAFSGALFALMGVSLAAGARRSVEDALSWQRQWRDAVGAPRSDPKDEAPARRRLALAYRLGGGFFAGIGLVLLFCAVTGRAPFSVAPPRGGETLFGGVFFTACGAVLAFNAWMRGRRAAPRFLDGELLADGAPAPLGERVAAACTHGMIALFLVFGARLLREALG